MEGMEEKSYATADRPASELDNLLSELARAHDLTKSLAV
jgi:hypothetical protein